MEKVDCERSALSYLSFRTKRDLSAYAHPQEPSELVMDPVSVPHKRTNPM